jgi:Ca2+-binding RTX toxin-like protein
MRNRRFAVVLALILGVMFIPATALAAPPDNDEFDGSVIIDALPFEATQDTSEATTSEADLEAASLCVGPPETDAAVWYSFTPTADTNLSVSTEGTDYSAGILVLTGGPGAWELDDCAPGEIQFFALAGVTHHLLIIDDQGDGGGNGGTLQLSVIDAGEELCAGIFANTLAEPGANVIIGTDGDDVLVGTSGRDVILGLDGDDTIMGLGGDDSIAGCDGDDTIDGGNGNDEMVGDAFGFFGNPFAEGGNDTMNGGNGDDVVWGGAGNDIVSGDNGDDFVVGHQGDDEVYGGEGSDGVLGGFGDDYVSGGNGKDFVSGGWGNDTLSGGNGKDFLNGAPPAFEEFDPEAGEAIDTCDDGNGDDVVINCEA